MRTWQLWKITFLQIRNDLQYFYSTLLCVLQMSTILLQTDLKKAYKVVNHSDRFLLGDGSCVLYDCLFQFRDWQGIVFKYSFKYPYKSGEFKSGKYGDNLRSRQQLTNLWVNPWLSQSRVILAVWGVAPSC